MKNRGLLLGALTIALVGSAVVGLRAQKTPAAQSPSPEMQAMMEAHRKAIQPGPQHLDLMRLVGEYSTKDTFYMPGAEAPVISDGAATIKSEMGERFLVEHNNGAYMGEPYAGLRIYGFNNGSKQYEGVWTYSASTSVMSLSGTTKDDGKSIDFTANFKDDTTGQAMSLAVTLKMLDPDHFQVELKSTMPNGSPGPRVVTTYTRKI
jgi:hypothetical protein